MRRNWGSYKAAIPIVSGIAYVANPLLPPLPTFAVDVDVDTFEDQYGDEYSEAVVLVHDRVKVGDASFIGGIIVKQGEVADDLDKWVVSYAAALPGYGPLVYDLAAMVVQSRIFPSVAQSSHAKRFWGRQADGAVAPLTMTQFQKKYGTLPPPEEASPHNRQLKGILMYAAGEGIPLERAFRMYYGDWQVASNPYDLEGRFIPERYLAGLPPALQQQRIRELTESRDAYRRGDFSELPTDRAARKMGLVKESAYTTVAKKRGIEWRGDADDMASRVLRYYGARVTSSEVQQLAQALGASFKKGLAAWKSGGHRPGATSQNWAVARVNSLVVGGKTAWTADRKQFAALPEATQQAVVAKIGDVLKALKKQKRQKDVEFLSGVLQGGS